MAITYQELCCWAGDDCSHLKPAQAYDRVVRLGEIAGWFFKPEVLQLANQHYQRIAGKALMPQPSHLDEMRSGECAILLLVKLNGSPNGPFLPVTLWRVRWEKEQQHDPHLPVELRRLADRVIEQLAKTGSLTCRQWGLRFGQESWSERVDLSELPGTFDSAFFSLAAGLVLAEHGIRPRHDVLATGTWDEKDGCCGVDGLDLKVERAAQLGARLLFVPETQSESAAKIVENLPCPGLTICGIPQRISRSGVELRESLYPLFEALAVPPDRDSSAEARSFYFLSVQDETTARDYYRKHIRPDIVENVCRFVKSRKLQHVTHFVSLVSHGFDLAVIWAAALKPENILLLCESRSWRLVDELRTELQRADIQAPIQADRFDEGDYDHLLVSFRSSLQRFLGPATSSQLAVDITSGKVIWKFALHNAAPVGAVALCCLSDFHSQTRRPKPFTERPDCWPIGNTWTGGGGG
ncbi:MAG: hypothetical protein KatS3mg109_0495 [Pirellulaceae bacterium]|nr:MAG: hypothetical protein KatS3mg109_0495 [Pirellulaceae bacterium]